MVNALSFTFLASVHRGGTELHGTTLHMSAVHPTPVLIPVKTLFWSNVRFKFTAVLRGLHRITSGFGKPARDVPPSNGRSVAHHRQPVNALRFISQSPRLLLTAQ